MHILLFILYGAFLCFALVRLRFFRAAGLRPATLLGLFSLHVAFGCVHNYIAWHYYPAHGDIWRYFTESFLGRQELKAGWSIFWADNHTWAYMPHNSIEWMHMLMNILSLDSLPINTLLFSFPVFWGKIALFRATSQRFPDSPLASLSTVLLPSCLFFTSCINTEAIIYASLGFLIFYLDRSLRLGWTIGRSFATILFLAIVAFYRPSLLFALVPAVFIWTGFDSVRRNGQKFKGQKFMILTVFIGLLLLLLIPAVSGRFLGTLSHRQGEFQELSGNSRITLPTLNPTWSSFGRVAPYAIRNGLFEPLPGTGGQVTYKLFSAELVAIWLIALLALIAIFLKAPSSMHGASSSSLAARSSKLEASSDLHHPASSDLHHAASSDLHLAAASSLHPAAFPLTCILFALLGMIQIGYIVPFIGAIIRYRSIFLPFVLAPALFHLRHLTLNHRLDQWLTRTLFS